MTGICKACLKPVKKADKAILCGHCDDWFILNVIILVNVAMKCFKVQRTHGSVFLPLLIFCETITAPAKLFQHNKHGIFQLIKKFNILTHESSNDDTNNSLNFSKL